MEDYAKCCFGFICWHIWKLRNSFVYEHELIDYLAIGIRVQFCVNVFWGVKKRWVLGILMLQILLVTVNLTGRRLVGSALLMKMERLELALFAETPMVWS